MRLNRISNVLIPIISILSIIGIWWAFAVGVGDQLILPTPPDTIKEISLLLSESDFYVQYFSTLLRCVIAFTCSFTIAFLLAILSYFNSIAKRIISPIVTVIRALPTLAIVLLLLIWTNRNIAPIIITMLVVMPTLYSGILSALNSVDKKLLEMCKVYKVKKITVFFKVIMSGIMSEVLSEIGAGLSLNVKLMVAAEVLAVTAESIGMAMRLSNIYFLTARLLGFVVLMVLTCLIIEGLFGFIAKKVGSRT